MVGEGRVGGRATQSGACCNMLYHAKRVFVLFERNSSHHPQVHAARLG